MALATDSTAIAATSASRRQLRRTIGRLLEQAGDLLGSPPYTVESALARLQLSQATGPAAVDLDARARVLAVQLERARHQLQARPTGAPKRPR